MGWSLICGLCRTERVSFDMVRHMTDAFLRHLNVRIGPRRVMLADSAKLRCTSVG